MRRKILMLVTILLLCLVSCSSKKDAASGEKDSKSDEDSKMAAETTSEIAESGNEYVAMLYIEDGINYEITLKKGTTISVLSKEGYQFEGYYTEGNENYVARDGKVIREYNGVDMLKLYPKFSPIDYKIKFYNNGEEVRILNRDCSYETNLMDVLPLGEVLGEQCIIGFRDDNRKLVISTGMEELFLRDLQKVFDNESRELKLNLITTPIRYEYERRDSYNISDDGFFNQKLDEKEETYELCSLENIVDIPILEILGYQSVEMEVTCSILEKNSGVQYIRLYTMEATDKKDEYIMESGKIEDGDKKEEKEYTMKEVVPIDKLESQKIYIYYNAGGIGKDNWISNKMHITFTFLKE